MSLRGGQIPDASVEQACSPTKACIARSNATTTRALIPMLPKVPRNSSPFLQKCFFQQPERLNHLYPDVYRQLRLYYLQDPLARISRQAAVERHNEPESFM